MAKQSAVVFRESTANRILNAVDGGKSLAGNSFQDQNRIQYGIWCITPSGGIAARTGTTILGATLTEVDCDVIQLVNNVIAATTKKLKVKNAGKVDIPGSVLICPFFTNFGWCAIWEGCDA